MITSALSTLIRFIGRRTFWKINKNDKIYLQNYYNKLAGIDGEIEFAKEQTKIKEEEILLKKEIKFYGKISKLFG